jgi:IS5 family transposase
MQYFSSCSRSSWFERALWERDTPITPAQRAAIRQQRSTSIMAQFHAWLKSVAPKATPESKLGRAIAYTLGQWPKLCVFLTHGDVPMTNNRVENAIRPFVVGRKGWLFSDTVKGTVASANLYSLVETAKANGVEPHMYLTFVWLLEQKRLLLKSGTIVDATIIEAPPSTKNEAKARDPEMRQTKKGKGWHFGMKAHVGTDLNRLVHSLVTTDAAQSDVGQLPKLLHGDERELYGDQAYWSEMHRIAAKQHGVRYRVNRRPHPTRPLTEYQRELNRLRSATRARCEHAFHVVKNLWGFRKVRYRGLAKNTARLFTAFALANLYLVRRRLLLA